MTPKDKIYRILEIIPGAVIWLTFAVVIIMSALWPEAVLYFITIFSLYWLFRVLHFVFYVTVAWSKFRTSLKINWTSKLALIDHQDYYHLIFLPTAKESYEVLETTFKGLKKSQYNLNKFIVVLAGEGRNQQNFELNAKKIQERFANDFFKLIVTVHPDGLPGEIKGKGANAHYAGKEAQKIIDQLGLDYRRVIVSYFDCDTIVHPQYFAALTYQYATHPNPTRTSFQPVVLFFNNLWDAPAISRVVAFSTTFWLLSELVRPERLFTFSSHSMSFKALVDVNFWQKDIVTDDSRIFLQCYFKYDGNYSVTPLFLPLYMDAVKADTYWGTIKNLYKQQRRWAWGIEHFPYLIWNFFFKPNSISLGKKLRILFNFSEGMYSWASAPILLFFMGRLPFWFADNEFSNTILALSTPVILKWLMSLSMAGILTSAVLSYWLISSKNRQLWWQRILILGQWLILPFTLMIFGALPATDAQTRLLLGKYLGFWVTDKNRVTAKPAGKLQYET